MTDQNLRDLLHERVSDLSMTDLSATAWRSATRIRTRRRIGAVVGVTAGALAVAGVAVVVDARSEPRSDPGPSTSSPSPADQPDATVGGAPVFWSPDPAEEDDLAALGQDVVLPETIDLAAGAPTVEAAPITSARAAFGVYDESGLDRVVLVTSDGERTLDLPNRGHPDPKLRLSVDGTSLHVASSDGTAATYSFASGEWVGERIGRDTSPEVAPQVARADAYGPPAQDPSGSRTAQSYGFGSSVPAAPGAAGHPETIVVTPVLGPPTILAISAPVSGGRFNQCCPVAGWLDEHTVVYESRRSGPRLLAWHVGTHDFELVSRIVGLGANEGYVAGFAGLGGSEPPATGADATAQGVPVWWSPDLDQELDLPWVDDADSPLPRDIDAGAEAPDVAEQPIESAVAAFVGEWRRPDRVLLLAPDGERRSLDVTSLRPLADVDGNASAVATATTLSPDGRHLVFAQRGHVMLYTLASGEWRRIETGGSTTDHVTWADPETIYLPPAPTGGAGPLFDLDGDQVGTADLKPPAREFEVGAAFDNSEGPWRENGSGSTAQSWGMGGPFLPVRDSGAYLAGPAYLAVVGPDGGTSTLAFMTGIDDYRLLDAPAVAGWLDEDTVVYESRAEDRDLLVAWDVGTRTFRRVASIEGAAVSSFARLYAD
jgi:hypothetical protein